MFADSTPLRPFSATPEMIRNPNFVFPVKPQESPSGSPVESRFARRSSVPHALGPVPVIPAALESRPRSSGSAAQLLAGVGILPPPPVRPTNSGRNSPVGGAPPSPFSFGSGRPIPQRTSGLAPNPVTIGPVPSRLRNASGAEGNGSETVAPSVAAEEKSSSNTLAAPVNKPPMRRGHAHRRSGAVSSSDVWALMNNSAPALIPPKDSPPPVTTPPPNSQPSPIVSWSAPVSPGPGVATPQKSPMLGPIDSTPQDAVAAKRANRVSFIEHVEIIPRPLSAASSQATVKGHIGQESISSLASFNSLVQPTSTPNLSRTRSNSHSSVPRFPPLVIPDDENRPSTANALLNSPIDSPIEGLSRNNSLKRTVDAAITPTTPPPSKKAHKKAISDFALASFPKFSSDTTTKNTNANARISSEDDSAEGSSTPTNDEEKKKKKKKKSKGKGKSKRAKENGGDKEDKEEGHSKKNKKKGWGLGKKVLGKHSKNRQLKALPRRSPTPPLPRSASGERVGGSEWVAAWNDSYVIVPPNWGEGSPSFMGQGESSPHSVESESPVIDLDAALGPFKTPQNIRGNFRAAKRYMHSSGRPAGSFGGPSFTGFHKRSESLPETRMELFALDENEGMEMGDVFEEEEEEEEDCSSSSSICSSAADSDYQNDNIGIGISIVDVDEDSDSSRRNSDASEEEVARSAQGSRRGSASSTKSARSLRSAQLKPRSSSHSMKIEEQPISPVIEEDEHLTISPAAKKSREHFRVSVISSSTQSSSSTVTPSSTLPVPEARPTTGNSPATSLMSLSTPYEESTRSNNHSEIYLAASETGSGFLAGEPSPDMRMSVDDVPSLTSCSSTMTGIAYREPATPGASESIKEGKSGKKSKKDRKEKRWSRVFGFLKIRS